MAQIKNEDLIREYINFPSEHKSQDTEKALAALLHKLALEDFTTSDSSFPQKDCCESCNEQRTANGDRIEEIEMIQTCWLELRQYIRIVYRLSIDGSLQSMDQHYQAYITDIVSRLFEVCDPHQLYERLEAQVREIVIEVKVRLLYLLERTTETARMSPPHRFISGMLDRYHKMLCAANIIGPVLSRLEEEHLKQFGLTWKLLNQRLFQIVVYSDVFFQNFLPLFISQLGSGVESDKQDQLVKELLSFDTEIGNVEGIWVDIDSSIHDYLSSENSSSHRIKIEELQRISFEGIESSILSETCECHVCLDASSTHTPLELIEQMIPVHPLKGSFHLYSHIHNARDRVDKATQKDQESNGCCNESIKVEDCHPISQDGESNDDSDSEISQSPSQDPRHCDCCYCEVFGHGLPSAAPMSKNYQEMRERLRLLLNRKKSKCKINTISPQQIARHKQLAAENVTNRSIERDTRALEDLLDFIEGTQVKCRNEKKVAKKARQKEKKRILLNRKKHEEEEKARMLEKSLEDKKRELLISAAEERLKKQNKTKKKLKAPLSEVSQNKSSTSTNRPVPQMVTIKRVMEPHNSEPTVTITLRGATPNQDRVLYTLLNGQVCKMKDVPAEKKHISIKNNITIKNSSSNFNLQVKNPNDKGVKIKKENIKVETPTAPRGHSVKPVKELTNPTSIQINNAVNNLSKKQASSFNIADIKLPPGITITKVDPTIVQQRSSKTQENVKKVNTSQIRPSSEVIVVSTGKRKDAQVVNESIQDVQITKKKKNKKINNNRVVTSDKAPTYPGLEIQPIKLLEGRGDEDVVKQMSVLTISPYGTPGNKSATLKQENGKKKKVKQNTNRSTLTNCINPDEWKILDSVFAPKDIDDVEMDDAERELEAFKRFCLQSIPPERKEKVHLNIKDIVLKKKSI